MPLYQYTARDEAGQLIQETIAFRDATALRHHLRDNNLFVLRLEEKRRSRGIGFRRKVRLIDLVVMTRQLRTMIQAGMPMVSGLEALAAQSVNPYLTEILTGIARSVSSGRSLAVCMADHPTVFPELMVTLVKSGEDGGRLPESLKEASRQLELQMEIRQKVVSAMVYPVFTLVATVGVVAVMLIWIVPVFAGIYEELKSPLPPPTRLLMAMSEEIRSRWWLTLLILIALGESFRRFQKTPEGQRRIDEFKLRLPLLSDLFRKSAVAGLMGSLAGLLESGVPLIQALRSAAGVCGNRVLADGVHQVADGISTGRRFSDELERTGHYPIMVVGMVAMSEDIGTLPEVLRQVAEAYVEEVEYAIRRIVALVEPIMVMVAGGIVGFVLVALYYPIFQLPNTFLNKA